MTEQIKEIKELINNRRTLEAKKKLEELEKRFEELEKFSIEVKRLSRNTGKSMSVSTSDLEKLFVKFNIKFK